MSSASPPLSRMRSTASSASSVLDIVALELDDLGSVVVRHEERFPLLEIDVHQRLVGGDKQRVIRHLVRGDVDGDGRPHKAPAEGRDLRIIDPDSIYHVISCGSDRGPIAWDDHDLESLFRDLDKASVRHAWEVFAWCAMTTHHHVVVRTPVDGFSPGFQLLNGNHA